MSTPADDRNDELLHRLRAVLVDLVDDEWTIAQLRELICPPEQEPAPAPEPERGTRWHDTGTGPGYDPRD
ncbi:hypothetical protein [Kribbella sp.]|uniref:hypothetical protein n=1 Tax=Kribbella sp. TaxID=1871183 RepID=UPI002D2B6BE5|nr:hypothetical protein [Kribbella sp.]HZX07206.1 hypothetical protein [Kribbella sp.]